MIFYVIELQSGDNGAGIITPFTDKTLAEVDFHQKAASAASSAVRKHGVIMVNEDGFQLKDPEVYEHGATQGTPEPQGTQGAEE